MVNFYKEFTFLPSVEASKVADAFGIDRGYKNVILDLDIPDELPCITYIHGSSGCGKSTLLRELMGYFEITLVPFADPGTPLFMWGENEEDSLYLLSLVGLGEATLFLSEFPYLSDSQKQRAIIYFNLLHNNVIVFDEFLATLDRETAKSTAFCIQKAVRKLGKQLIVATSHSDLAEYLQPDLEIIGEAFPSRWKLYEHYEWCHPYLHRLSVKLVDKEWYKNSTLGDLHYRGKYSGGKQNYMALFLDDKPVGILVATVKKEHRMARLVIHPSYRGCGFATYLQKKYLEVEPNCTGAAAMGKYTKFSDNAGLTRVKEVKKNPPKALVEFLVKEGFNTDYWFSRDYCTKFCADPEMREKLVDVMNLRKAKYIIQPGGKKLTEETMRAKLLAEDYSLGRFLWSLRPYSYVLFKHEN